MKPRETALKTIKFAEEVSPDEIAYYNIATPYPGTPMYDNVVKNGWLRVTNFDDYDATRPIFETPTMSMKELQELYDYAIQTLLHASKLRVSNVAERVRIRICSDQKILLLHKLKQLNPNLNRQ